MTLSRDYAAIAKKVLVLGLDGATFDVLGPLMDEGVMPNLKRVVETGASGTLWSTIPPITPAAWTTFLTGKNPGRHGIIDFERYDPHQHRLEFNNALLLRGVRNLWHVLGDRGLRVGSINVPMTFPASKVNGFLISGFETPDANSDFVYPSDLKADLLARWPDPTLKAVWKRSLFGGDALFARNVRYMSDSFHQGAAMVTELGDRFGWDVLMVVLKLVDNLQHKTWKYIDPRWRDRNRRRTALVRDAFAELDRAIDNMMQYAAEHEAAVLMVSDHGHGSLEGKIHANQLLINWGYLGLHPTDSGLSGRLRYLTQRGVPRNSAVAREGVITEDLPMDSSRTRACVMHAGMAGFVYLNLKGRQPQGIVDKQDYEPLRDELRERFLSCTARDPDGNMFHLFPRVDKPEELYGCSREEQPWMPDLILTPRDGLSVVRKLRGGKVVKWLPYRKLEGTHRPNGIIIAHGAGIAEGKKIEANIVDCAPTVLAMMGLKIPADMQGKVIESLFAFAPQTMTEQVAAGAGNVGGASSESVYSEEELARVTERLSDLGYLE